ncbi:hypothetical protein D8837_02480 [Streptococcus mitis]|uniref:Uncharacterized protein n=1 Tax=Streptococcus mitis TaxID=28037 RepID=A0A3R9KLK4_STRMT|nr:hypothetical protein D8837_02480 [Streptococcus mitis]
MKVKAVIFFQEADSPCSISQDTKPVRTQRENRSSVQRVSTPWKNYLFHTRFQACSISKIQAFLTSLEVLTKSLEYNLEQYFLLLGGFQ